MRHPDHRYPDRSGCRLPTLTTKDVDAIYTGQGGQGGQGIFAQKVFTFSPPPSQVSNTSSIYTLTTLTTLTTLDIVDKYRELSGQGRIERGAVTLSTLTTRWPQKNRSVFCRGISPGGGGQTSLTLCGATPFRPTLRPSSHQKLTIGGRVSLKAETESEPLGAPVSVWPVGRTKGPGSTNNPKANRCH